MGFPTEFFPVLFAIPRMAGYLAHWRESLDDPDTKIMRPAQVTVDLCFRSLMIMLTSFSLTCCLILLLIFVLQVYTGIWLRHYTPPSERKPSSQTDELSQVSISNSTRRRLAGSGA